jgi:hypothetical protein
MKGRKLPIRVRMGERPDVAFERIAEVAGIFDTKPAQASSLRRYECGLDVCRLKSLHPATMLIRDLPQVLSGDQALVW